VVGRCVQVMLGGGMLGGCHDGVSSSVGFPRRPRRGCPNIPTNTPAIVKVLLNFRQNGCSQKS